MTNELEIVYVVTIVRFGKTEITPEVFTTQNDLTKFLNSVLDYKDVQELLYTGKVAIKECRTYYQFNECKINPPTR